MAKVSDYSKGTAVEKLAGGVAAAFFSLGVSFGRNCAD
jgi:hypothetical protein